MLAQDASTQTRSHLQGVNHGQGDGRRVRIDHCSEQLAAVLSGSLPSKGGDRELASALPGFVQQVVMSIILSDVIDYEVELGLESTHNGEQLRQVKLGFIPSGTMACIWGSAYQLVPRDQAGEKGPVRRLDRWRVARFRAPRKWRGYLARLRRQLLLIRKREERWQEGILDQKSREDFSEVHRQHDLAVARCTSRIGWHARGQLDERLTSYHAMLRGLRWHAFCIELREEILRSLGGAFQRIGAVYGEEPKLVLDGLVGIGDVREAEAGTKEGSKPFNDLLEKFHRPIEVTVA